MKWLVLLIVIHGLINLTGYWADFYLRIALSSIKPRSEVRGAGERILT